MIITANQGRRQKISQGGQRKKKMKNNKKDWKIALLNLFQGDQWKKDLKITKK